MIDDQPSTAVLASAGKPQGPPAWLSPDCGVGSVAAWCLALTVALLAIGGGCGGSAESEAAAAKKIEELGAFVRASPQDKRVKTVNVSTTQAQNLDAVIQELPALVHLENFNGTDIPITDDHLKVIGQMESLIALVLPGTEVTDVGMPHLKGLQQLENLDIRGTAISNKGLSSVAQIQSLKILNIGDTQVSGDLSELLPLKNLEWLLLGQMELSDDIVDTLVQFPKFGHLQIPGATISEEALKQLSQKKPGVKITR